MPAAGASAQRFHWLDLRRPGIRDAVIVVGLASTVFISAALFGVLRLFSLAPAQNEGFQLHVLTVVLLAWCLIAVLFGCRRIRHMDQETRARALADERAAELARHDPMTGLANRRFFTEKVDDALRAMRSDDNRAAVLVLDIDRFRSINDRHGARTADNLLSDFAARISAAAGSGTVMGRMGGDVFAILQSDARSLDDPTRLARRLMVAAGEPFRVDGVTVTLGISIGIAVAPDDGSLGDVLLRRAELALRRAKAEGRASVRFFEREMDAHLQKQARVEEELRSAIGTAAIGVHYQPIVSLADNHVVAFEALARWKSPKLGWVQPGLFIPIAEECGLMHELGNHLLRRACRDALTWPDDVVLAFNVSPSQSRDQALALRILSILDETGMPPCRLQLEISDRALIEGIEIVRQGSEELRRAGVQLVLGGFGTGYATVSQLLQLRFDKIKIGRGIVHRLGKDADSAVVARAMVALAEGLGLGITAECVETWAQVAKLKDAGCPEGQGFLFGKAVPPSEIPMLLRRARRSGGGETGKSLAWETAPWPPG
jgi:diguanylate cyclase (GGDEF)-like protein